jgi:hypothetical protein
MLHLQLSERDVEQLLAGDQPQGRSDLAEVARFVARLRALSDIESSPPMNPRLLAELDVAEAGRTIETADEREQWRELERRRAHTAKRRWRYVGAAAMIACLGGVVAAAQAQGSDPSSPAVEVDDDQTGEPTTSTPPTSRPEASNGPKVPPTTLPPPPEEPDLPAEQPASHDQGQVGAPGPPTVEQDQRPIWMECGADPECWMRAWPQFVPGSDRP